MVKSGPPQDFSFAKAECGIETVMLFMISSAIKESDRRTSFPVRYSAIFASERTEEGYRQKAKEKLLCALPSMKMLIKMVSYHFYALLCCNFEKHRETLHTFLVWFSRFYVGCVVIFLSGKAPQMYGSVPISSVLGEKSYH